MPTIADVSDLLERLARHKGQARAVERLLAHYEGLGRIGDGVRVADGALDLADAPDLRKRLARDLVRLRVSAARGGPGVFARAMAHVESDLAKRPELAGTIHRALLRLAIAASKRAPTDGDFVDATGAAWRALDVSTRLRLEAGDVKGACRLLYRGARLPFERPRRRELLRRAVELWSEVLGDTRAAIRLLDEIFQDDAADSIAVGLVGRFAALLRTAGQEDRVARLWEESSRSPGTRRERLRRGRLLAARRRVLGTPGIDRARDRRVRPGSRPRLGGSVRGSGADPRGAGPMARGGGRARVAPRALGRSGARSPRAPAGHGLRGARPE